MAQTGNPATDLLGKVLTKALEDDRRVTGILILIGILGCIKEVQTMDIILEKYIKSLLRYIMTDSLVPQWLARLKSRSLKEWFENWPQARQDLNKRRQPPKGITEPESRLYDIESQTGTNNSAGYNTQDDIALSHINTTGGTDSNGQLNDIFATDVKVQEHNNFGININEIRQARIRTIIYTTLGCLLVLVVTLPVIIIIIVVR